MTVLPIASSSKGNSYVVAQGGHALLIDCGIAVSNVRRALGLLELDLKALDAVLVTHNHVDHVSGLKRLLNAVDVPIFANAMTAEATASQEHLGIDAFVCFENGQSFEIGPFAVTPFSVPHDASDPVGYLVRGEQTYFHGTDIGLPLDSIGMKLVEADLATLESNHDPVLLRTSDRPPCLKQRIAGPRGHLSNEQACELVERFASPRLKHLWLAHLSAQCNAPHLALAAMQETLRKKGLVDVVVEVAA